MDPRPLDAPGRVALELNKDKGAVQSDRAGTNINAIVAQFRKTGTRPRVTGSEPIYGDYTWPEDLHSMREAIFDAEDRFNEFPADVRSAANNDWVQMQAMYDDPGGQQILIDAGLEVVDADGKIKPQTVVETAQTTNEITATTTPTTTTTPADPTATT